MNIFEKQQRVDAIREIVYIRWYSMSIVVALGLILKTKFYGMIWGNFFDFFKILVMGGLAFGYNFYFWLYLKKPIEKMTERSLATVALLQVVLDQLVYTFIYYYTGTIETIAFLLYFLTILIASSLYKTKGIVLTGLLAAFLYTSTTLADYYKIVPHIYPFPGAVGWFGNTLMTRVKITGFIFYTGVAVFFSAALSNLLKKREKKVLEQRDKLQNQTEKLIKQTKEISMTRDRLKESLDKSNKLREEASQAKKELEEKVDQLEKFYKITVGREMKMAELKNKIEELEKKV